jgi:hypothetical protein
MAITRSTSHPEIGPGYGAGPTYLVFRESAACAPLFATGAWLRRSVLQPRTGHTARRLKRTQANGTSRANTGNGSKAYSAPSAKFVRSSKHV